MTARIFQHELDHLDGILFYNRANRYHRDQALKKWKRGDKFEMKVSA
jgi:peptide deformylase